MPGQLTISAQDVGEVTQLSGICTVPGDQSTHNLTIKILTSGVPPVDMTEDYEIPFPIIPDENGRWIAAIMPQLNSIEAFTIEVSCTHDGTTVTASMNTQNITGA